MNLSEFFHMGGYAAYVWSSYALAAVVLGLNLWLPARRLQQLKKTLRRRAQLAERRA
ncbi:heme exporter protein CcmD [Thiohalobacter sp. IOR34]|uniref:heme exporter protein CcmD n=1 Tax=Thiohalobacter sp. IOR34 TaxID=3057176 RepID=UPI0025AFCD02|nr:heme exporter protein CcmD [Thiohalobacter sp. IOR34]WJW76490.1 heme exporter protein CcmD [Thiohalobacter sp. IOR34]